MTKFQFYAWPRWFRDFSPLIFWMALIFILSAQPRLLDIENEVSEKIVFKLAHVMAYALLTWFWWRALASRRQITGLVLPVALALTILYGISDEIHQLFVPGRSGQVADVLFDTSGALAMILFLRRYHWLRHFPENLSFSVGLYAGQRPKNLS